MYLHLDNIMDLDILLIDKNFKKGISIRQINHVKYINKK